VCQCSLRGPAVRPVCNGQGSCSRLSPGYATPVPPYPLTHSRYTLGNGSEQYMMKLRMEKGFKGVRTGFESSESVSRGGSLSLRGASMRLEYDEPSVTIHEENRKQ
jgi:hypothetical protein